MIIGMIIMVRPDVARRLGGLRPPLSCLEGGGAEACVGLVGCEVLQEEAFLAAGFSCQQGDVGFGDVQQFGEITDELEVGGAFHRFGGEADFKRVFLRADNG